MNGNKTIEKIKAEKRILENLRKELQFLQNSEMAKYDSMKEQVEQLVKELNRIITTQMNKVNRLRFNNPETIQLNKRFTIKENYANQTRSYIIVPANEVNYSSGKISVLSPLANLFMGKKIGDKVIIDRKNIRGSASVKNIIAEILYVED